MTTSVLSILRGADSGSPRENEPALDVNAYAVADEIDLTILLAGIGVELALARADRHPISIAGVAVPTASPDTDLQALLASGVQVLATASDLDRRGLTVDDLVPGVEAVDDTRIATLIAAHDVTLSCA